LIEIRDARAADERDWRELWAGYQRFYEIEVPERVTAYTWARILDPASPVFARLAESNGSVMGFSIGVLHDGTWAETPVCYLEDLFVAPAFRLSGAGRALIQDLVDLGRQHGWSSLYWHTKADNVEARRLYDRFASADGFLRYRLSLRP